MGIGERIQTLRKGKGISQEELADKVGVSRQAVSKWESEQSVPDVDRLILLSEQFDVTTDYLLKGMESQSQIKKNKLPANIFVAIATMLNAFAVIASNAEWYERQDAWAFIIWFIFAAFGCMVFAVGTIFAKEETKVKAKYNFWVVNIWLLIFVPLSFVYTGIFSRIFSPYPLPQEPLISFVVFWAAYIAICMYVVFLQKKKRNL